MTPYSAPTTRTSSSLDRLTHHNDELALIEHAFSREIVGQCELALAIAEADAAQITGTVEATRFVPAHRWAKPLVVETSAPGGSSATATRSASPLTRAGRSRCRNPVAFALR